MDDQLQVQVAHTTGITRCCYVPAGANVDRIVTAGDDHLVRLLPADAASTENPMVIEDAKRPMTWVDADETYLATASEDGEVRLYRHNASDASPTSLVHIIRREALPVRGIAIESSRSRGSRDPRVAICSDELIVRVVNAADTRSITLLTGHSRGVRAASWSPQVSLLLTCSSDGSIRAWDMSAEPTCVRVFDGILPSLRPESEYSSLASWHPSGKFFAVYTKTNEVQLINAPTTLDGARQAGSWSVRSVLGADVNAAGSHRLPRGPVSAISFCPNGRYLAVATEDLQVTLWDTESLKIVRTQQAEGLVTSIAWHPTRDAIAWTDVQGQLVRWAAPLGSTMPSPAEPIDFHQESEPQDVNEPGEFDDLFEDTIETAPQAPRRDASRDMLPVPTVVQPGATPMYAQRRYLALSPVGTLTAVDQDTHQTIAFESYDTSQRRNFRFTDHYGYTLGAIGAQGVLVACDAEESSPSSVFFRPFDDIVGIQNEWSIALPQGEAATAVALGGVANLGSHADEHYASSTLVDESRTTAATAIVATSRGYLRFFGPSGLQRYIWALGLPVVALAASKHAVLVVFHAATVSAGYSQLAYQLIELAELSTMQQGVLPLSADTTLVWAGFSDIGAPAVFDSEGTLFLLDRAWRPGQGRWVPVLDTVAALTPKSATVSQKYPQAGGPRPVVQELELAVAVAQPESQSAQLEGKALCSSLLAGLARDSCAALATPPAVDPVSLNMEADKALLQLVQLACKSEKYARALDATRSLHSEATLDAAIKIASFFHLPNLGDRMQGIREPLAVRKELENDETERACGVGALLRNTASICVPEKKSDAGPSSVPESAVARALLARDFEPPTARTRSILAEEGAAAAPASSLPSLPSDIWPESTQSVQGESQMGQSPAPAPAPVQSPAPTPLPAPAPRSNPFARTSSSRSSSMSLGDGIGKRKDSTSSEGPSKKRGSGRQSTLGFAPSAGDVDPEA
ncbi:DNA polymerase alpha accessory factor Mcl1 [Malassezia cuniculi]|uniref:DNA polymerase alpha accessory factor Mcl1 n=1 Tax=Malassezia cuniculi TaxID=948313 RepID=A0AAF0J728_9BASI|nr:DNA polymerase alpha accessory factor Mcl1 [Malassezia cuniculi]